MENLDKYLIILVIIILTLIVIIWKIYNNHFVNFKYINPSSLLYIKESPIGGKGVFAKENIKKDTILEISPYIQDNINNFVGVVRDYVFSKNNNTAIVAFGYASMYNHSENPSATWTVLDNGIKIVAIKDINKDDEIFISYGDKYWNTRSIKKI